jgi:hypothetical protein
MKKIPGARQTTARGIAEEDGLVKSRFTDDFVKSSKFKARESRVMRRTYRTPQWQRDEAQRRSWTFCEVVKEG